MGSNNNPTNPWADATNQAVGALYKYYMSRPTASQIQQQEFEQKLLEAKYGTELATQRKLGFEADGLEMRNNAPSSMRGMLSNYLSQAQSVQPTSQNTPLNVRNNNPGNLRPIGGHEGFQQFDTPQAGLEAMRGDLMAKISGQSGAMSSKFGDAYQPTLENIINTWAPPVENNTNKYLDFVQGKTGFAPDRSLTEQDLDPLMQAMVQMEGGQPAVDHFYGQPSASGGNLGAMYNQYAPQFLEAAMQAAIEKPDAAPALMQMMGGVAQFNPDILANIQSGAGTDYADTQAGFREELNNPNQSEASHTATIYYDKDGQTQLGFRTDRGQFLDANNQPMDMTNIVSFSNASQPQGSLSDITPLRPTVEGQLQEKDISFDTYRTFSDNLRKEIIANPQSVGTRGNLARLADGILGQVDSIAPNSPFGDKLREIVDITAGQYTDPVSGEIMNKDLYSAATISSILPFVAGDAILGQSGRSLSNEDRVEVEKAVGKTEDWFATPEKSVSRLDQLDTLVNQLRMKYQGRLAGTRPVTPPSDTDPLSVSKVQKWGRDANGNPVPIGGQ